MSDELNLFLPPSDDVSRVVVSGGRRAVLRQWRQRPGRVSHHRPQSLGGVRERDEGFGRARSQRHSDHVVRAKGAGGQLHGHRRVGLAVATQRSQRPTGAPIPVQRVRQPAVYRRLSIETVPRWQRSAASSSAARQRRRVRSGQFGPPKLLMGVDRVNFFFDNYSNFQRHPRKCSRDLVCLLLLPYSPM